MDRGTSEEFVVTTAARRSTKLVRAGAFSLAVAVVASCRANPERTAPLTVGDSAPAIGLPDSIPGLTWVFRKESCLGCGLGSAASEMALVSRRFDGRVAILVVAVGAETDADRRLVETFLQRRRVSATVVPISARNHSGMFGDAPIPSLYLTHEGRVQMMLDLGHEEALDSQFVRLDNRLDILLPQP